MIRMPLFGLIAVAAVCGAGPAPAAGPAPVKVDYARTGCYVGLAGAVAFETEAEDAIESATGLNADISESLGIHARVGCRGMRRVGGEIHYEWLEGFDVSVGGADVTLEGWALTGDLKLWALTGRIQPFATLGFGYLSFEADGPSLLEDDWDFAARFGGGIDFYLTRHIVLNVDATYVLPTSDALEDADYVTVGWGFLYRF